MTFNSGFSGGSKVCPLYGGGTAANPANILVMQSAPPAAVANQPGENPIGTIWINVLTGNSYQLVQNTYALGQVWTLLGGGASAVATINSLSPTAGNIIIAGTASQITATSLASTITLSIPAAFVAPGSIAATTTVTATLGDITATNGDFVSTAAAKGPKVVGTSVAGATPIVNNVRAGQVAFSDDITAGSTVALVMTNSLITAASVIIAVASCSSAGSACLIRDIAPGSGTVTFNTTNLGASSAAATININFWILN